MICIESVVRFKSNDGKIHEHKSVAARKNVELILKDLCQEICKDTAWNPTGVYQGVIPLLTAAKNPWPWFRKLAKIAKMFDECRELEIEEAKARVDALEVDTNIPF